MKYGTGVPTDRPARLTSCLLVWMNKKNIQSNSNRASDFQDVWFKKKFMGKFNETIQWLVDPPDGVKELSAYDDNGSSSDGDGDDE